jgi:hypothetical protein
MYFVKKNTVLCRKKITFFCYKIYNISIGIDNKNYNAIKNKYIACKEKKIQKHKKSIPAFDRDECPRGLPFWGRESGIHKKWRIGNYGSITFQITPLKTCF